MADRQRGPERPRPQNVSSEPTVEDDRAQWLYLLQYMQQEQSRFMMQMMQQMHGCPQPQAYLHGATGGNFQDFFRMNLPEF